MYSEPYFELHHAASVSLANANKASLFGTWNGLSLLNNDDVVRVEVISYNREAFVLATSATTFGIGYRIDNFAPYYTPLPPMRAGSASQLGIHSPGASATATTIYYGVYRRVE